MNRNKIKRAIRESFRCLLIQITDSSQHTPPVYETLNDGSLITAFDVIVLAKSTVATLDNAQLNKELKRQWLRLIEKRKNL